MSITFYVDSKGYVGREGLEDPICRATGRIFEFGPFKVARMAQLAHKGA